MTPLLQGVEQAALPGRLNPFYLEGRPLPLAIGTQSVGPAQRNGCGADAGLGSLLGRDGADVQRRDGRILEGLLSFCFCPPPGSLQGSSMECR